MKRFDELGLEIVSEPIIEMESPFYLGFDVVVQGDIVPAFFIGDRARAMQKEICVGDKAIIREGLVDNGKLVFQYMELERTTGKNINVYA